MQKWERGYLGNAQKKDLFSSWSFLSHIDTYPIEHFLRRVDNSLDTNVCDNEIIFFNENRASRRKKPSQVVPSQTPDPQVFLQPEQFQEVIPDALLCSHLHKKNFFL